MLPVVLLDALNPVTLLALSSSVPPLEDVVSVEPVIVPVSAIVPALAVRLIVLLFELMLPAPTVRLPAVSVIATVPELVPDTVRPPALVLLILTAPLELVNETVEAAE